MKQWGNGKTIHQTTQAQQYAFDVLKKHKFAVIVGRKGDGKTSIARDIILEHANIIDAKGDHNTLIVEIEDPIQILDICSRGIEGHIIFLADDALGKSAVDTQKLDKWQRKSDDVGAALRDSDQFKLVITMRKHIWNKTKSLLEGYDVFGDLVDLTSTKMSLQPEEKANILRAHLSKNHHESADENLIMEVSETFPTPPGYPQCCSMFSRVQKLYNEGVQFFKNPSDYLQKVLEELSTAEPNLYVTLALTLVFRGQFKMKYFSKENLEHSLHVKACVEEIMECCGRSRSSSLGELKRSFEDLRDVYFEKNDELSLFQFNHDSIEEAVAKHFGDKHPDVLIKCCHIKSLQQWVCTSEEHRKDHDQHVVSLHCGHFPSLAQRLNEELCKGNADIAFSLISAQDDNFVSVWIQSLTQINVLEKLIKDEGEKMFVQASKNGVKLFVEYLLTEPQRSWLCLTSPEIDAAMTSAICNGHPHIMEILFPLGVSQTALESAFELVVEIGHLNTAKCLLEHSPELLSRKLQVRSNSCENILGDDTSRQHPIHLAAYHGSSDILEYLLSNGINPNVLDSRGKTPLHHSCENGYSVVTEILLSRPETGVNIVDSDDRTPLHYAAKQGHYDILQQLKNKSADVHLRDKNGKTAVDLAFAEGHHSVGEIIQSYDFPPDFHFPSGFR